MIKQKRLIELLEKSITDFLNITGMEYDGLTKTRLLVDHLYWVKSQPVYGFFTLIALSNLSQKVFSDTSLMDMALDCSQRFAMNIALVGPDEWATLIETIVTSAANLPPPSKDTAVLIPSNIYTGLYIDPGTLRTVLMSNWWIVWMYLVLLYAELPEPVLPPK
jgi:hypothetical protein